MKWNRSTRSCVRVASQRARAAARRRPHARRPGGRRRARQVDARAARVGKANPSVETLWAIAAALRVPFARLVEEERTALRVVRASDVPPMHSAEAPGWAGRLLAASHGRGTFDLYTLDLDEGTVRHADPHHAGVVEHLIVVVGRLRVGPADRAGRARRGRPRDLRRRRAARLRGARDDALRAAHGVPLIAAATISGLLELGRVARAGDHHHAAVAGSPAPSGPRSRGTSRRARRRPASPASPARRAGPTAAPSRPVPMPAQRRGEARPACCAAGRRARRRRPARLAREQRLRAPLARRTPRCPIASIRVGERRRPPRRRALALGRVGDPRATRRRARAARRASGSASAASARAARPSSSRRARTRSSRERPTYAAHGGERRRPPLGRRRRGRGGRARSAR